jgi:toxin ParE1/3/4
VNPRFIILPAARADLMDQFDYIAQDSLDAANRFLAAAAASFGQIAQMPRMGRSRRVRNPRLAGLRQWAIQGFEKHLIFYRETTQGIEVLRVLHGARDIQRLLEE